MQPLTWANRVTIVRILLVGPFILLFLSLADSPARWKRLAVLGLFAATALTDMLDGYLARRLHQTSHLGRLLDPLADKLLVLSSLVLLVVLGVAPDPGSPATAPLRLPVWVLAASL